MFQCSSEPYGQDFSSTSRPPSQEPSIPSSSPSDSPRILRDRQTLRGVEKLIFDTEAPSPKPTDPPQEPLVVSPPRAKKEQENARKSLPLPSQGKNPRNAASSRISVRKVVLDKATKGLLTDFKAAERQRNLGRRQEAWEKLMEELFRLQIRPSVIIAHSHSNVGLEFLCAWIIDAEDTIKGWLTGNCLQEHAPELLADYLMHLPAPDPRATCSQYNRQPSPVRAVGFPQRLNPAENIG